MRAERLKMSISAPKNAVPEAGNLHFFGPFFWEKPARGSEKNRPATGFVFFVGNHYIRSR
jgi:hypothetical protein